MQARTSRFAKFFVRDQRQRYRAVKRASPQFSVFPGLETASRRALPLVSASVPAPSRLMRHAFATPGSTLAGFAVLMHKI
jgi:hypothetical protein